MTVSDLPEMNGLAERMNRTILTEEKPVTERQKDEPSVEVDVGSSGSRASLPAEEPAEVPVKRSEDVSARERRP